jgi:hypothetical protein
LRYLADFAAFVGPSRSGPSSSRGSINWGPPRVGDFGSPRLDGAGETGRWPRNVPGAPREGSPGGFGCGRNVPVGMPPCELNGSATFCEPTARQPDATTQTVATTMQCTVSRSMATPPPGPTCFRRLNKRRCSNPRLLRGSTSRHDLFSRLSPTDMPVAGTGPGTLPSTSGHARLR